MSVINQMLKDLDKRQNSNPQSMSPLVEDSGKSARAYILMALVLIALAISAWLALRYFKNIEVGSDVEVVAEAAQKANPLAVSSETEQLQAVAEAIDVELAEPISQAATPQALVSVDANSAEQSGLESDSNKQVAEPTAAIVVTAPKVEPTVAVETTSQVLAEPETKQAPNNKSVEAKAKEPKKTELAMAKQPSAEAKDKPQAEQESALEIKPLKLTREQQVALYTRRGFQALDKNLPDEARKEFQKALQLDHQAHEVREQLAALMFGRGELRSAVSLLEEGLQLSPMRGSFRVMLARIFVQQDNLVQAIYYLESAEPSIIGNVDYYAMLAGLAQRLDKQELALTSYQKLVKHEPSRARWWLGYAIANDKLGSYQEALAAYQQAELMGQLSSNSRDFVVNRIRQLEQ
ncbi:tetratricopeptide repeat protein [Agarivorans albus]|uniref:MSHA biogenesis protein MshN n=1 Tax=Agarivorans albus MKT 106 TaxID=1331007 RepID=R9PHS6_AGAAL|nr:tetratricopeptide repeat protein [Agarivorans albus]GAD00949.1 MSHA biogenesis protein MshN [Agarivorans albus MKT 106]